MSSRHELSLEEKMMLIREKEKGLSHRQLCDKFQISLGVVSNILKRKSEYCHDYETNCNKKLKRKGKSDLSQEINDSVYEWFTAQRAKEHSHLRTSFTRICTIDRPTIRQLQEFQGQQWLARPIQDSLQHFIQNYLR
jgi:hypothetical protein